MFPSNRFTCYYSLCYLKLKSDPAKSISGITGHLLRNKLLNSVYRFLKWLSRIRVFFSQHILVYYYFYQIIFQELKPGTHTDLNQQSKSESELVKFKWSSVLPSNLHSLTFRWAALSPPLWCLLPHWFASLTLCSCGANNTNPSVHGSDLMNRKIVGRELWGYHSCQIPGQSGHFVWGKDLALSRLGSHSFPLSERSSRQQNKASKDCVAAVCKSHNSKISYTYLFFHYCSKCFSVYVSRVIGPLDTFISIHNPPHDFSCRQSENSLFSTSPVELAVRRYGIFIWQWFEMLKVKTATSSLSIQLKDSEPAMTCRDDKYVKPSIRKPKTGRI